MSLLILSGAVKNLKLLTKQRHGVVAFDLASICELQFFRSVLLSFAERNPRTEILIIHHGDTVQSFSELIPALSRRVRHVPDSVIRSVRFSNIDLFLTTEQYDMGLEGIYSVALFHGQPSKGLTFSSEVLNRFDALFLYGPMHRESLDEFVREWLPEIPSHLTTFEIGYPKSDDLLNGRFDTEKIRAELSLDPSKKTVLYAPAFNEGASLREHGIEIITLLAEQSKYNILVKLPIDCCQPTSNIYATGGINWFEKIGELQSRFPNLRLYSDYQIDPLLACADVLITCISSVGFEFLALNRPVVFIDTPEYFSGYLKRRFPEKDTVDWAQRMTVNGGKEFGLVVKDFRDLPAAIETVLAHPDEYPRQQERLKHYLLYNRGHGTEAAVAKIEELLAMRVKSRRPQTKFVRAVVAGISARIIFLIYEAIQRILNSYGFMLTRTGLGYHNARAIVAKARVKGLSICEYLESQEKDERKKGRRDRIIGHLVNSGILKECESVCEIGAGTGMYLEKVLDLAKTKQYEVYETDRGWVDYLKRTFGKYRNCTFIFHPADGSTLKYTKANSCDLVHAHAVFVYIPILQVFEYLKEASRVCKPGGYVVFDCCLDKSFDLNVVKSWLLGSYRFPVIIPEKLLFAFAEENSLSLVYTFNIIYGSSFVDYLVFQKKHI